MQTSPPTEDRLTTDADAGITSPSGESTTLADPFADAVGRRARQLDQLYGNATLGLAGSLGTAALVAVLVYPYSGRQALLWWLGSIMLASLGRYALVLAYRQSTNPLQNAQRWLLGFSATIAISGLCWGGAMFILHQPGEMLVATLISLCIGGLIAGSTASFSSHYPSILAFSVPSAGSAILALWQGPIEERTLAGGMALFTTVVLMVALRVSRLARSDIARELENRRLIDVLVAQKRRIAAFNSRLEASVAERTRKLEQEISVRAEVETALRDSEARFRQIFEHTGVSMLVTDLRGRVLDANSRACSTFGYSESQLLGRDLMGITHPDDQHLARHELVILASGEQSHLEFERRYLRAGGEVLWGMVNITATSDSRNDDHYLIVAIEDITEARSMAQQLSYQANHDPLTGLFNRHQFERELQRLHESARDTGRHHMLVYLDLDRFKLVNDACGHLAGDELLRQLGHLLREQVRESDTVARLGGDEFGLLLEGADRDKGLVVVNKLVAAIEQFQFRWLERSFSLGVSAGVLTIQRGAGTPIDLLRNADSACYTAKETGRHRIQFYDDGNAELAERRGQMGWINRIEQALQQNRFTLYAQPIQSLKDGRDGVHCEVLLRMLGDDGELIAPGDFLPAAERYGLCPRIDAWVLETVYHTLDRHGPSLAHLGQCSINLSGQSLSDENLIRQVSDCARGHAGIGAKICFEVTETTAITNLTRVRQLMHELKEIGCRFALDDFGSGFSSYGYLNDFPVDYLKIDGQFVRDIDQDPVHRAMVRSISEIGQLMGKQTVAEYVENRKVLEALQQIGVDFAQGWHLGKPRPLDDYLRELRPRQQA